MLLMKLVVYRVNNTEKVKENNVYILYITFLILIYEY